MARLSAAPEANGKGGCEVVSIKDIAKACGVSAATVSKALNDQGDISEATKKRIRQTADSMGYMPNSAARALKTHRTYNLGVLYVDEASSGLTHEFFAAVLDSFKRAAESKGYDITFINRNIGRGRASYTEHCRYRGVDGVMAACVRFEDAEVIELLQSGLPVVTVDYVFNNRMAVLSDNTDGIERIVSEMCARGHERIAYIHGESHSSVTEKRLACFYRVCEAHGIKVPDEYVCASTYRDAMECARLTHRLLALPKRPTAILFPDDFSAVGGIQAIRNEGLLIPHDISVAGYDGILLSQVLSPKLATYKQDTETMGRVAAERLIAQIESPRTVLPEQYPIKGKLVLGESIAPPPHAG